MPTRPGPSIIVPPLSLRPAPVTFDVQILASGQTYQHWRLPDGQEAILCRPCRLASFNAADVAALTCPCCGRAPLVPEQREAPQPGSHCPHQPPI